MKAPEVKLLASEGLQIVPHADFFSFLGSCNLAF